MKKETAANLIGVKESSLKLFKEKDPFNNNLVEGFICRQQGEKYGTLIIYRINEIYVEEPQIIKGTPKLKYPFNKSKNFKFPKARRIDIWEKLDGTNILGYRYKNSAGTEFITYKTRLSPFIKNSEYFAPFLNLWKQILRENPQIKEIVLFNPGINLSFELYGHLNQHLIAYKEPIAYALLFGVDNLTGDILSIDDFRMGTGSVKTPRKLAILTSKFDFKDMVNAYGNLRKNIEGGNTKNEDDKIEGREGAVWYLKEFDRVGCTMYKCKPPGVEEIHWANNSAICKPSIVATIYSAYEELDEDEREPSLEKVERMLLEEYNKEQLRINAALISRLYTETLADIKIRNEIMKKYRKLGLNIKNDKAETMRILSNCFEKKQMRTAYSEICRNLSLNPKTLDDL